MPDNQVFTNPSNSYCSMSQPVRNLSKFSFRIKSFWRYQLTGDFSCRWGCLPRCWRLARWVRYW